MTLTDGGGTSAAYTTCNGLNFANKTDWRVPTMNELKTLIHCNDKTMPLHDSLCGEGNYTSPAINKLFPWGIPNLPHAAWSSTSKENNFAYMVNFNNGQASNTWKTQTGIGVRCVSGP